MVWNGFASLALLCFAVYAVETVLGVVFLHGRRQWSIVRILDRLLLSEYKFELGFTFCTGNNIALFSDDLVFEITEPLLTDEFRDGSWVYRDVTAFEEALERAILIDELLGDVLDHAGLAEEMPALLDIKQALNIEVGVELLLAFEAVDDVRVVYRDFGHLVIHWLLDLHRSRFVIVFYWGLHRRLRHV
jgi:hypothetical protein